MSGESCLVCATDQGVFLDVAEHPALISKAHNCGLAKVSGTALSIKVCHKCAFEIEQCHNFVEKVKKANSTPNPKRSCCSICFDPHDEDIFFDLSKQTFGVNDFIQKVHELFIDDFKNKEIEKELVCLSCRYCVDLLTDLRNLSEEVPSKLDTIVRNGINPADLPKIETSIVSRNTTLVKSSNLHLNTPSDTDSDSSSIMASSKKKTKKNNSSAVAKTQQKCQKCKTAINGVDVYTIHITGSTVCKTCWLSTDHGETQSKSKSKKRKKIDHPDIKLNSVLLEDILLTSSNDHKEFKIEKDDQGNTSFKFNNHSGCESKTEVEIHYPKPSLVESQKHENHIGTEENEEIKESKSSRVTNRRRKESEQSIQEAPEVKSTKTRQLKESEQSIQEISEIRSTRNKQRKVSEQSSQDEPEMKSTRSSRRRKDSEQSVQETANDKPARTTRRHKDSEQSIQEINEDKPRRTTRKRKDSEKSIAEEPEIKPTRSTRNRKRGDSEQSLPETVETTNLTEVIKRRDSEQSIQEDVEINVDVDSDTAPVSKKAKKSEIKAEPKQNSKSKVKSQSILSTRKRGRSSSVESTANIRKSARNTRKNKAQELDEIIEIENESETDIVQKENVSDNEDTLPESKRSKRSDSISSNESVPAIQFKTPSNKSSPGSTPSIKDRSNEVQDDDKVTTSKSLHTESSESEEIDILKSTDEETKGEDTETPIETPIEDKNVCESKVDDDAKSNKDEEEQIVKEIDIAIETNVKTTDDESPTKDDEDKSDDEIPSTPTSIKNSTNSNIDESPKLVIEEKAESEDQESTENTNVENDVADEDEIEKEQQPSLSRRSSANSIRSKKTKSLGRRKSKKLENNSVNDVIIYDNSDSEDHKTVEKIESYTCTICDKEFENKFIGLQHELTHLKTLEIKLPRVEALKVDKSINESNTKENEEEMEAKNEEELNEIMNENETEQINENENEIVNENGNDKLNDEEAIDNKTPDTNDAGNENLDADAEEVENEEIKTPNETEKIDENDKENEESIEKDTPGDNLETEQYEHFEEESDEDKINKYSPRRSTRNSESKPDKKPRGRRKTIKDTVDSEEQAVVTTASDDDKIAEAVKETLNDIAELQGKTQAASTENGSTQEIEQEKEDADENDMEIIESTDQGQNVNYVETMDITGNDDNEAVEINEVHDASKFDDDVMECDPVQDNNEEAENNEEVPYVVDVDAGSPREVVDIEQEDAVKQAEESEVEITEIEETETKAIKPVNEIVCEQVDLTENDDNEIPKPDDDIEIEEVIESNKIQEDENTVDSVTEINVIAEEEASVENDAGNTGKERNEVNNDDEDNNTEDEALAQQSLEELLQRKGLQVIDEFAESVTDADEESEKEANVSSEKENCPEKDADVENELEIKISDAECTEILGINNRSINKQKDVEVSITDENQIIQDVDVVEEVINDSGVVQEVEVESNVVY